MLRLVTIDLSQADIGLFEAFEGAVLPLVAEHGGEVVKRLRALDGRSETHLLHFPDAAAFEAYRSDPRRLGVLGDWEASGAKSTVIEVEDVAASTRPR
jgi:hypothetical protein